jgi:pullulanase/glycogen debranching enzyme
MLNAYWGPEDFTLPHAPSGTWEVVVDTMQEDGAPASATTVTPGSSVTVGPRALVVAIP